MKKFPKIDIAELEKQKKQNFEDRLKFIDMYAAWVKKNMKWSSQQKSLFSFPKELTGKRKVKSK